MTLVLHSVFFLLFFTFSYEVAAQTHTYGIYRGESRLGEIKASRVAEGNEVVYKITSESNINIIWKYVITSDMEVIYEGNIIKKAISRQHTNDELKEMGKMYLQGKVYSCFRHPDETFELQNPVTFSTARLYFEKPTGLFKVFSESFLEYCELEILGVNQFLLLMPDGSSNRYTYNNQGELEEIFVSRSLFDISFRRE